MFGEFRLYDYYSSYSLICDVLIYFLIVFKNSLLPPPVIATMQILKFTWFQFHACMYYFSQIMLDRSQPCTLNFYWINMNYLLFQD